jgi:uncharacterized protein YndB with AHSA1/START domain
MSNDRMTKTVFLDAGRETVWAFLTRADKLALWFHRAAADLAEGEDYQLIGKDGQPQCWGTVTTMRPHERLTYSFTFGPANGTLTDVTWLLDDVAGGTRLTLHHDGISNIEGSPLGLFMALDMGWDQHLSGLREGVAAA